MHDDYRFVRLSEDDLEKIRAVERELAAKYDRHVVLIAYEGAGQHSGDADADGSSLEGRTHSDITGKRGTTFGGAEVHGDHYPTLAGTMGKDLAGGEDLRFGDIKPPRH